MAVTLRAVGSPYNSGTSSTSTPVVNVPAGVVAGDHLRCTFEVSATAPTISNLNGWTQDGIFAGSNGALVLLSKTADAADAAGGTTCAPTFGANYRIASPGVGCYYDTGGGTVSLDGSVVTSSGSVTTAGNPIPFPASNTPATTSDMAVVYVGGISTNSGDIGSFTGPGSPWTLQSQACTQATTLKNSSVAALTQQLTAATATTSSSVTNTKGQSYQTAVLLLKASAGGGGTPPTANAGADQSKAVLSTVTLSATAAGGTAPYTYAWTHVSGPSSTASLSNSAAQSPTYTAPASATTPDVWQVTVTDSASLTGTDSIQVNYTNAAPTANAGADQNLAANSAGQTVTLVGSSSDPEGSTCTLLWRQISGPTVTLSNTTVASPTFSVDKYGGTFVFGLTATDSGGVSSAEDTVQVVVGSVPYMYVMKSGTWVKASLSVMKAGVWS